MNLMMYSTKRKSKIIIENIKVNRLVDFRRRGQTFAVDQRSTARFRKLTRMRYKSLFYMGPFITTYVTKVFYILILRKVRLVVEVS
jgi:hypothetical protein